MPTCVYLHVMIALRRAWLRLALGILQMSLATGSFALLLQTGASSATIGAVCLTTAVTVASLVIFRKDRTR